MELPKLRLPDMSDTADRSSKAAGDGFESITKAAGEGFESISKVAAEGLESLSGRMDSLSGRLDSLGSRLQVGDRLDRLALADRIDAFRNPRRDEGPNALAGVALLGGLGLGMAMMYFLDPQQGARRRELLASRVLRIGRDAGQAFQGTARDLRNRGRGGGAQDVAGSPAENTLVHETPYVAPALDETDAAAARAGAPGAPGGGGGGGTTPGYGGGTGGGYGREASEGYGGASGGTAGYEGGTTSGGYDASALDQPTPGEVTTGGSSGGGTSGTADASTGTTGLISDPEFGEIDPKVLQGGGGTGTSPQGNEWSSTRSESRAAGATDWGSSGTSTTSDAEPSWRPADAGTDWESSGIRGGSSAEGDESSRRE